MRTQTLAGSLFPQGEGCVCADRQALLCPRPMPPTLFLEPTYRDRLQPSQTGRGLDPGSLGPTVPLAEDPGVT